MAETPDPTALAAFAQRAADGPVVMLNLLKFLPDGGAERYGEYGEAVAPLLAGWEGARSGPAIPPRASSTARTGT